MLHAMEKFANDKDIPDEIKADFILCALKLQNAEDLTQVKEGLLLLIKAIEEVEHIVNANPVSK